MFPKRETDRGSNDQKRHFQLSGCPSLLHAVVVILILGGSGYLASEFSRQFTAEGIEHQLLSRSAIDYSTREGLLAALDQFQPDFLINAAGYTGIPNVDASESNKTRCLLANTALPALIAEVCADRKLTWGHLSTGCIYSGTKPDGSGYTEADVPNFSFRQNNCSFYSGTKALAEEILQEFDNVYLWRFRRPFNQFSSPRNYLSKVIAYDHQLETENSITQVDELVNACHQCLTQQLPHGIYHITNPGIIRTSEVIELIQKHGLSDKAYSFYASDQEFYQEAGRTPRSECILDSSKIQSYGIHLTEIHDALDQALKHWTKI